MTASGAINATNINRTRRKKFAHRGVSGPGIFGWTATHVHEKIVTKQLVIIVDFVRTLGGLGDPTASSLEGTMGSA